MCRLILGTIWLAGLVLLVAAKSSETLDDKSDQFLVEVICDPKSQSKWQITKIETIDRLFTYFERKKNSITPLQPDLNRCANLHYSTFKQLHEIVHHDSDDVCSRGHIDLIESFHRDYISHFPIDKYDQWYHDREAPKLVIRFFMHYVYQVADACKSKLIEKLDLAGPRDMTAMRPEELEHLDKLVKEFFNKNGSGSYKEIKGITLLWNVVEKNYEGLTYSKPNTINNFKRATAATASADKVLRCQRECNSELKPIYAVTLLPVIRLIDLGYYMDDEPFAKEIATRPTLRRLIGVTLICEFVLPLRVVQDDSLKLGQINIINKLKDEDENETVAGNVVSDPYQDYQPFYKVSLAHLQRWPTADPDKGVKFARALKANIRSHEKVFGRVLKALFENIKNIIKSFIGPKRSPDELYPTGVLPLFKVLI